MARKKQSKQPLKSVRRAKAAPKKRAAKEPEPLADDEPGAGREPEGAGSARPARKRPRATKKRSRAEGSNERSERSGEVEDEGADPGEPAVPATAPSQRGRKAPVDLAAAVLLAAATNERMNQYLLEHLDPAAWTVKVPGEARTIAAIVTHVHNVRHMWLAVAAKDFPAPEKLDRRTTSLEQARTALGQSFAALQGLLERSLASGGKVKDFRPDVVGFLGYVIAHEAHHRGQICQLARQAGFALPKEAGYGLWDWNKRAQEIPGAP